MLNRLNCMSNRYFAREFRPDKWHVCDRQDSNRPLYDDEENAPLVFDEDRAVEYMRELEQAEQQTKQ